MAPNATLTSLSTRLTSRRGAWVTLALAVVAVLATMGGLAGVSAPTESHGPAASAESTQAEQILRQFPDADLSSVLLVAARTDAAPLREADQAGLSQLATQLDADAGRLQLSEDGSAAVVALPFEVGPDNAATASAIKELRSQLTPLVPDTLTVHVTGGPAFGADVTSAFDGANVTLLLVTIGIVALLLILTYRSPILWLLPLTVVALADQVAGRLSAAAATAAGLEFSTGILSVLVFGAATNYALLLISRYREELLLQPDHRVALAAAWRKTVPTVAASAGTVILAVSALLLASVPGTRGLGAAAAIGVGVASVAILGGLTPVLALVGRKIFWPLIPRPGIQSARTSNWLRIGRVVTDRPLLSFGVSTSLLAVLATGIVGASIGLTQLDKFRTPTDSGAGLEVLAQHFPAGQAQPIHIVTRTPATETVLEAVTAIPEVVRAHPTATTTDGAWERIMVTGSPAPGTEASYELIDQLRAAVDQVDGAEALVGGALAAEADLRANNATDLTRFAPLVVAVTLLVLILLLRALVAPVILVAVNLASAVAALGAGVWLSQLWFGQSALDFQVPLLAFLFLVALGVDYTIFLVHRARTEAAQVGTKEGIVQAVGHTGSVITSAGIVLAAVFAALGVLPIVTLGQIGLIVGVGVLLDTFVVRTIMVPALFAALGDRIWWPNRSAAAAPVPAPEPPQLATLPL